LALVSGLLVLIIKLLLSQLNVWNVFRKKKKNWMCEMLFIGSWTEAWEHFDSLGLSVLCFSSETRRASLKMRLIGITEFSKWGWISRLLAAISIWRCKLVLFPKEMWYSL
jgi:hypothetical protein